MPEVSESGRAIARTVAGVFGGTPTVIRYWDDDHRSSIDLMEAVDAPQKETTSYSTIGLSDWPLIDTGVEYPARLEITAACGTGFEDFGNAIATAALNIINSQWFCYPCAVFPDTLAMYAASMAMRRFFFVSPFLWEKELARL
jgi:hypothetical protein